MNKYLPSKQESKDKLTRQQVYHTVYHVVKHDNSHLGEDKASRVANQVAVKSTWYLFNDPRNYGRYVSVYAEQLMDELGVRYVNI